MLKNVNLFRKIKEQKVDKVDFSDIASEEGAFKRNKGWEIVECKTEYVNTMKKIQIHLKNKMYVLYSEP